MTNYQMEYGMSCCSRHRAINLVACWRQAAMCHKQQIAQLCLHKGVCFKSLKKLNAAIKKAINSVLQEQLKWRDSVKFPWIKTNIIRVTECHVLFLVISHLYQPHRHQCKNVSAAPVILNSYCFNAPKTSQTPQLLFMWILSVCVCVCVCILKSLWFGKVWWVWESVVRVTLTQIVVFSVSRQWNSHFKSTTQCAYLEARQWPNHTMFKSFWLNCFLTRLPTALTLYINTVGAGSFAVWQVWPHTAVQFLSSGPSRAVNLSI